MMENILWKFIRGDMPLADFTQWLYTTKELEPFLGEDLHLDVILTNFENRNDVVNLQEILANYLIAKDPRACVCVRYADLSVIGMESDDPDDAMFLSVVKERKNFGDPYWWLNLYSCNVCKQNWLLAQEERMNDIYILKRISAVDANLIYQENKWPASFRTYEELLKIGYDHGVKFRFCDPLSSSLCYLVADLIKERDDITPKEISVLLNLDEETAKEIYELASNPKRLKQYLEEDVSYMKYGVSSAQNDPTVWQNFKEHCQKHSTSIIIWCLIFVVGRLLSLYFR